MVEPGKAVKDINISNDSSSIEIFNELKKSGGFESRNIADGVDILANMIQDEKCLKFLSFIGAIISTGFRAPNLDGLFGVQARHVSSIISIGYGEIKITQNGKEKFYLTTGGYADIKPEGVILILETFTEK